MAQKLKPMIDGVSSIIGYKIKNRNLLWEAFQAPGLTETAGFIRIPDGNRKLALVGDAALKLALVEELYTKDIQRGKMNEIISRLVSNQNLVTVGTRHGLNAFVNRNPSGEGVEPVTMAATVEAVIGAVYLEGGISSVSVVCRSLGLMPDLSRKNGLPKHSDSLRAKAKRAATLND